MQYGKVSDFLRAKMKDETEEHSDSYEYYTDSDQSDQMSEEELPKFGKNN